MLDPKQVANALEQVASFIDRERPRGKDAEQVTFRQFSQRVAQMERELGATPDVLDTYGDDPLVHAAIESVGMAMDDNGLIAHEQHELDFPIAYRNMPEYCQFIEAEQQLWKSIGDAYEPTAEQWAELVRHYKP